MIPYWSLNGASLYQGHTLDVLPQLPAESVQCIVTSPPYWGLRDYGLPPLEWPPVRYAPMPGMAEIEVPGCDPECEHVWGEERKMTLSTGDGSSTTLTNWAGSHESQKNYAEKLTAKDVSQGQYCQLCGGWRGCLGLEPTPEMFVGHIVLVARELWRVLRDDGTFWLNFGDSYATRLGGDGWGDYEWKTGGPVAPREGTVSPIQRERPAGLKPKDLIGIPWRVAFALQADGWWLRSDVIWAKGVSFCPTYSGSCMPESVRDRPTKGHEMVFLLSKNARYFYDGEAVRESAAVSTTLRASQGNGRAVNAPDSKNRQANSTMAMGGTSIREGRDFTRDVESGRNLRTVWTINPGSYAGAHFATFPPALVEPMIKAGTSAKGCCPECGAPWERVVEKPDMSERPRRSNGSKGIQNAEFQGATSAGQAYQEWRNANPDVTTGWIPTCTCDAGPPVPCTVLDPFFGSGTVGEVAIRLGRRVVGIELSQTYCDEHIIPRLEAPIQPVLL